MPKQMKFFVFVALALLVATTSRAQEQAIPLPAEEQSMAPPKAPVQPNRFSRVSADSVGPAVEKFYSQIRQPLLETFGNKRVSQRYFTLLGTLLSNYTSFENLVAHFSDLDAPLREFCSKSVAGPLFDGLKSTMGYLKVETVRAIGVAFLAEASPQPSLLVPKDPVELRAAQVATYLHGLILMDEKGRVQDLIKISDRVQILLSPSDRNELSARLFEFGTTKVRSPDSYAQLTVSFLRNIPRYRSDLKKYFDIMYERFNVTASEAQIKLLRAGIARANDLKYQLLSTLGQWVNVDAPKGRELPKEDLRPVEEEIRALLNLAQISKPFSQVAAFKKECVH